MKNFKFWWVLLLFLFLMPAIGYMMLQCTHLIFNLHPLALKTIEKEGNDSASHLIIHICDTICTTKDTLINKKDIYLPKLSQQDKRQDGITIDDLGVFGDSAGFWNAIFSALAMFGVIITLYYQRNKDLDEGKRLRQAQFQDEFYRLTSFLSELIANLEIRPKVEKNAQTTIFTDLSDKWNVEPSDTDTKNKELVVRGRSCFKYLFEESTDGNIKQYLIEQERLAKSENRETDINQDELRALIEVPFGHYFRYIYRILKHIDESNLLDGIDDAEHIREEYSSILRAQLSTYELILIFYNALHPEFQNTSKRLIEKYAIFNNLNPKYLVLTSEIKYYGNIVDANGMSEEPDGYDKNKHYSYTAFRKPTSSVKHGIFSRLFDKTKSKVRRIRECIQNRKHRKKNTKLSNKIIRALENKKLSDKEIAKFLGETIEVVTNCLVEMVKAGKVEKIRSKYRIKK